MPRLASPKIEYLPEGEAFTWQSRNMPVYDPCDTGKGLKFCVAHNIFMTPEKQVFKGIFTTPTEQHLNHASTHILVWYCEKHERFEEC